MNQSVFLAIHDVLSTVVNTGQTININYDLTGDQINVDGINYDIGQIKGITVTTLRLSNDNENDSDFDITTILQQVEKITFTISFGNFEDQEIVLDVKNRRKVGGKNDFFYFEVNPFNFVDYWGNNTVFSSTQIFASPILSNVNFAFDDYNPIFNNSIANRPSTKRQVADRISLDIHPSNLDTILSQSATPAEIPDSNYTLTGLVNSRYEGTKTDAEKFGGVLPAFTGRTFVGEQFSNVVTNLKISSSLEQDRTYKDLFHSGEGELPSFQIISSSFNTDSTGPLGTLSNITVSTTTASVESGSRVNSGDIVYISSSQGQEFMRVKKIDTDKNIFTVERQYLSDRNITSDLINHSTNISIQLINPTKIFEFGSGTTKIELAENAKILVKESRLILETDKYGNVFTSASLDLV